jgi:hypothetical protein
LAATSSSDGPPTRFLLTAHKVFSKSTCYEDCPDDPTDCWHLVIRNPAYTRACSRFTIELTTCRRVRDPQLGEDADSECFHNWALSC